MEGKLTPSNVIIHIKRWENMLLEDNNNIEEVCKEMEKYAYQVEQRQKNREKYQQEKVKRKIYIKLNGQYIEGKFADPTTGWIHYTTSNRSAAHKYNYYSMYRITKYYAKLNVKVDFEFVREK